MCSDGVGAVGGGIGAVGGFAGRKIGLVKKKDKNGKEFVSHSMSFSLATWFQLTRGRQLVEEPFDGMSSNGSALAGASDGSLAFPGGDVTSQDFAISNGSSGPPPEGSLSVTVLSAQGLAEEVKSHVLVSVGSKSHKTSHSSHKSVSPEW